jgi:hypothetical protein
VKKKSKLFTEWTWNELDSLYRKRPARYKAVQYIKGAKLPPGLIPEVNEKLRATVETAPGKFTPLDEGDWVVLDLVRQDTFVVKDNLFYKLFEGE